MLLQFLPQLRSRLAEVQIEVEDERKKAINLQTSATEGCNTPDTSRSKSHEAKTSNTKEKIKNDAMQVEQSILSKNDNEGDNQEKKGTASPTTHYPTIRERELKRTASHLKLFLDFVDEDPDLRDILQLRAQIALGTLEEIAFEDLWHLFQPGELILFTRGPNHQLLRVCAVTGGAIQLRNHTREEQEHLDRLREQMTRRRPTGDAGLEDILREEASGLGVWTPLTIDCYVMAFDGTEIGPLDHCKRIKHYSGKRSIQDLDVHPIRFHPRSEELLKQMEERGRKVLNSYGHKRYRGGTINASGTDRLEDIRSDVFIDMKTYFTSSPWQTPSTMPMPPPGPPGYNPPTNRLDLGHLLKTKTNPTETSERLSRAQVYLAGHEVDTKLSEDFMASNRALLQARKIAIDEVSPLQLQLLQYPVVGYAFRYRKWCKYPVLGGFAP